MEKSTGNIFEYCQLSQLKGMKKKKKKLQEELASIEDSEGGAQQNNPCERHKNKQKD